MKIEKHIQWSRWIIGIGWSRTWKFFQITFGPLLITISWLDDGWKVATKTYDKILGTVYTTEDLEGLENFVEEQRSLEEGEPK